MISQYMVKNNKKNTLNMTKKKLYYCVKIGI